MQARSLPPPWTFIFYELKRGPAQIGTVAAGSHKGREGKVELSASGLPILHPSPCVSPKWGVVWAHDSSQRAAPQWRVMPCIGHARLNARRRSTWRGSSEDIHHRRGDAIGRPAPAIQPHKAYRRMRQPGCRTFWLVRCKKERTSSCYSGGANQNSRSTESVARSTSRLPSC